MNITTPKTLILVPDALALVLDALAELPFKKANPVIQDIFNQLRNQEEKDGTGLLTDSPDNPAGDTHGDLGKGNGQADAISGQTGAETVQNRKDHVADSRGRSGRSGNHKAP